MSRFDFNTATLGDVLTDVNGRAILEKYIPKIVKNPAISLVKKKKLDDVFKLAKGQVDEATAAIIRAELQAL